MTAYTGQLGIVLLPTGQLGDAAAAIAKEITPNSIDLGGKHPPHLTLYHAQLKDVPEEVVRELLALINNNLPFRRVTLSEVTTFAEKFVFWDKQGVHHLLTSAHYCALEALSPYYNPSETQQAAKEGLELPADQQENVRRYGHPLVKGLWRPHITVAYNPEGYPNFKKRMVSVRGTFTAVAFVEVGEYGTVKQILMREPSSQPWGKGRR